MGELTTLEKGRLRDDQIVALLSQFHFATREQVQRYLFAGKGVKQAERITQRRLRRLFLTGRVKRHYAEDKFAQRIYFLDKRSTKAAHHMAVLDFYLAARAGPGYIVAFTREFRAKLNEEEYLLADALMVYRLSDGKQETFFVEVDLASNPMNKYDLYKKYYYSNLWRKLFPSFPKVVIVTTDGRATKLSEKAKEFGKITFTMTTMEKLKIVGFAKAVV